MVLGEEFVMKSLIRSFISCHVVSIKPNSYGYIYLHIAKEGKCAFGKSQEGTCFQRKKRLMKLACNFLFVWFLMS
jgi:hypothetical protein